MPRMMHPKHGFHVCSQSEVSDLKRRGWDLDDGKALAAKIAARRLYSTEVEFTRAPVEAARAELDALGIKWDGRWSLKRLLEAKG